MPFVLRRFFNRESKVRWLNFFKLFCHLWGWSHKITRPSITHIFCEKSKWLRSYLWRLFSIIGVQFISACSFFLQKCILNNLFKRISVINLWNCNCTMLLRRFSSTRRSSLQLRGGSWLWWGRLSLWFWQSLIKISLIVLEIHLMLNPRIINKEFSSGSLIERAGISKSFWTQCYTSW